MKTRDTIKAKSHKELLNTLLNKQLNGYMQCTYNLHNGYKIWMIRLDGQQSKDGWTNDITDYGKTITEIYTGDPEKRLSTHKNYPHEKRLIFGILGNSYHDRIYIFHGVFELDKSSTNNYRKWNKISDYYNF